MNKENKKYKIPLLKEKAYFKLQNLLEVQNHVKKELTRCKQTITKSKEHKAAISGAISGYKKILYVIDKKIEKLITNAKNLSINKE